MTSKTTITSATQLAHAAGAGLEIERGRLNKEIPNSVIPNQYGNPDNPNAHFHGTGAEIWNDFGDTLNMCVLTAGTGGTIAGVAKYLKEKNPNIRIIGVDPQGSILGGRKEVKTYHVEGIGYDFIPDVLSYDHIDDWVYCNDRDSFLMARP